MISEKLELKIYKELSGIWERMFMAVFRDAQTSVLYDSDKPEHILDKMKKLADPGQWVRTGIINETDKANLELMEYLLNDQAQKIEKYKSWKPENSPLYGK